MSKGSRIIVIEENKKLLVGTLKDANGGKQDRANRP